MAQKKIQHESILQKQVVQYLRAILPHSIIAAIPNGSQRTSSGRPANAISGLLPGIPDLMVMLPKGRVIFFELKSEKGRVSDAQLAVHLKMHGLNHDVAIVRSIDDVKNALDAWEVTTRESKNGTGNNLD
jgi:hypothetical protein